MHKSNIPAANPIRQESLKGYVAKIHISTIMTLELMLCVRREPCCTHYYSCIHSLTPHIFYKSIQLVSIEGTCFDFDLKRTLRFQFFNR